MHWHHRRGENQRQKKNAAPQRPWQLAPCGLPQRNADHQRYPHRGADERKGIGNLIEAHVDDDIDHDRGDQNQGHDEHARPVDHDAGDGVLGDGRVALLLQRGRDPEHKHRRARGDIRFEHLQRMDAVDPHHGRRGVADDAARAARVGRGDNRREITDVNLVAEHRARDGTADERRRDVVQKAGQHKDHHQQDESALPVVRQELGQSRGDIARLEVLGQQRKPEQQSEQIHEQHPFMAKMRKPAAHAGAFGKG